MINSSNTYEGKQDNIRSYLMPDIEVFSNIYSDKSYRIDFEIPEFTAICPKTGLPDFGTIYISYKPNEYCIELKSLKEYITSFRDIGIFHENVVNKICDDLIKFAKPHWLKIRAEYKIRGGIKTVVSRTHHIFK